MKKIVFMGTPNFAVPILKSLYYKGYNIPIVYTQAPKKSERGQKIKKSPIHLLCEEYSLNVKTQIDLENLKKERQILENIKPDLVIVAAYGKILPKELLNSCPNGFINIHASLLPKWRGAAPIQRSIMNLDIETGISIMKIDDQLDHGSVCSKYKLKILKNENAQDLSLRLSNLAAEIINEEVELILNKKKIFVEQIHSDATYARKIRKNEGKINWDDNANLLIAKINGLYPSPGAWFLYKGQRYKILKAEISKTNSEAGLVVDNKLEICCGSNSIKIKEIQREGKKIQSMENFILGTKIKKGLNLKNA